MQCPHCQCENPSDAGLCSECGARFELRCSSCGTELPAGAKFCPECGQPVAGAPAPGPRPGPASYTPKHLVERILTSRSAMEGERKQVTVLFADVRGSVDLSEGIDPEEWHRIMDRFFQILMEGVHRFEGTVNQFTGDGIMALFGAPIAHEDHAHRACYAALHLRTELRLYADELKRTRGIGLAVRMGLNSGEVVVGKIGDDLRMDYTAHGRTVGLADRMQKLADPGAVYLTHDTAALVSGYMELRDLGSFDLKGIREPVRVYELAGVGAIRTRLDVSRARGFSRFVGRSGELATLEAALDEAREGRGQVVLVVGDAGVGKSRLCFEFVERARARGVEIHAAHAVPYGGALPFQPVMELLRSYFGITNQDDPRDARKKIAGTLLLHDEVPKDTVPLVFDFLGVSDPEHPAPELDPEVRERRLYEVFSGICPCHREPTVILVEDLHWVDPGSGAFLAKLAEAVSGTRTLLLLNYRPGYEDQWIDDVDAKEIDLLPLGDEAIDELLNDLLGTDVGMQELAARIREQASGNPFFVEEVVQSLVEAGSLEGGRGTYRIVEPVEKLAIPATVQAVLAARIDRLDPRDKEVLQTAAVIGKEFSEELLGSVAGLPEADLSESLRALEAGEFVYAERLYPRREYAFKHPITQEVVYRSQLADRRSQIHASVARAIEGDCGGCHEDCAALVAHHWEEAGDAMNAARWILVAGNRARTVHVAESLRYNRKALELLDSVPDCPETLTLALTARAGIVGAAAFTPVSSEELERAFAEGKALAQQSHDPKALAGLLSAYSAVQTSSGNADAALDHALEAVRLARESGDPQFETELRVSMMFAYYGAGRLREAVEYAADSYDRVKGKGAFGSDPIGPENLASRGFRAMLLTHMGRLEEAERDLLRVIQIATELGKSFSWMRGNLVDLAGLNGRTEAALAQARLALEEAERYGSTYFVALAYRALGVAHSLNESWGEAIQALELSLNLIRETRSALHLEAAILEALAEAYLATGEESRARELAEEAVKVARQNHTRLYECRALLIRARVLRATEGPASADTIRSLLDEAADLVQETGARSYAPFITLERAELARTLGEERAFEQGLREARQLFIEIGAPRRAERIEELISAGAASPAP